MTRKRQQLSINLGEYLDESNTVTKQPTTYRPPPVYRNPPHNQVFEPKLYVAIENAENTDVIHPWLVANDQRDWWSVETMARELWLGALALIDSYGRGRCCDHDIYEAWADGAWHFLDSDMMLFLLNRDNRTVASSQDLVRDAEPYESDPTPQPVAPPRRAPAANPRSAG